MNRSLVRTLAATIVFIIGFTVAAQPHAEKGPKGGPERKGPPRYDLGEALPPFVRDNIELSPEQQKQIADLEKDIKARLSKILTAEQLAKIASRQPRGFGEPKKFEGKDPREEAPAPRPAIEVTDKNMVRNGRLTIAAADGKTPANFAVVGNADWLKATHSYEFSPSAIALRSGSPRNASGSLAQDVTIEPGKAGRWYRFSIRGLPEANFKVNDDDLFMRVEFATNKGRNPLDGVTWRIYPHVANDRKNLGVNGNFRVNGAAVWKSYAHEFKLPFAEIDTLRMKVGFGHGVATAERDASFYVTDVSLVAIPDPADAPKPLKAAKGFQPSKEGLIRLGGRWYYDPEPGVKEKPARLTITAQNANRLYYLDNRLTNPFAENMTSWLRKGNMDLEGRIVEVDRFLPDNVIIEFNDDRTMIIRAKNVPNHPTGQFPERFGKKGNPSFIQEHNYTYYLPLNPVPNPRAIAMDKTNSNRALQMGATALAINGVVFYNPFDIGNTDATDMMDRCCGHPSPDNRYHYHKYPVCVKSPFVDDGDEHSPLIGFAFDGFPIYGPYESKGLMAKDDKTNPLNEFNIHCDDVRGWHYHVTPGKYPYVIGGYYGVMDPRNVARKGPPGFGPKR